MPARRSLTLVRALDEDWRAAIDGVARAHKWPTSAEPAALGALVRALSDAYNAPTPPPGRAVASSGPALAARLGFSFARDVPKAAAAVRELVLAGELAPRADGAPLRVLDIGCGLGATTWGVARAFAATGQACAMEVTWTDEDALALDVARALAKARGHRDGEVRLTIQTERRALKAGPGSGFAGPWDLVLLGQVLSELDGALDAPDRVRAHAELVAGLTAKLAPRGALVVVEPALRERTRHLHAVRDAVLATREAVVFAPCLHSAPCPALEVEGEWCHEDLAVDLPPWLEPVARAAGLRWQGLTFSYLVLRRPGERTLAEALPRDGALRARVISGPLVSKGKREHFVCAEPASAVDPSSLRVRVSRLDRDEAPPNVAWSSLTRGDVVGVDPAPDAKKNRIGRESSVAVLESPERSVALPSLTGSARDD